MRWYVVHTQPRAEAKALWHLENQGFCSFMPWIPELKRHARQTKRTFGPLFPRYLFVCFDLDLASWRAINGTRGVVNLLTRGSNPLPAPPGVVEALRAKCDRTGRTTLAALGLLTQGSKVKVNSGVFAGQMGKVTEICVDRRHRVQILLTLLGAEVALQLPSYAIEAA